MNPAAMSLAQARFLAALAPGVSAAPVSLNQLLTQLSTDSQSQAFDAESICQDTGDEFPFLPHMNARGTPPDAAASAAWEAAIRWLLSALRNWDVSEANSLNQLRALLGAVTALDANLAGLSSVATQVASTQLITGLRHLIENTDVDPGFNERRFPEFRQQIESLASNGNLKQLGQMVQHMNFFPSPDFGAAVIFMFNAEPAELAAMIESQDDILFSVLICTVLESQAIVLASRVNNLVFKFISVAISWQDRSAGPSQSTQSTLQALLLQVAQTSAADWAAWMQALFKAPGHNTSLDAALGSVLQQLSQAHWTAFFKALSLNYSHRAAAPVANILVPFANSTNAAGKTFMWASAHQVWSDWGYGKHEGDSAMFAPAACALDFPVAMYYASMQSNERSAEESKLQEAINTVEQEWFTSVTELVTERNRLKSRLRLVQHGTALANGSDQALPPPIQADADHYAEARYHYHDVNIF
ncbi:hypothetical protein [Pantoea dispersa]|uniref:hypothetical protein n=1 Tax=Pantoea dispersa TaxID=59814 RepID=UPI001CA6FD39|nr:hypothetical protein [Pantoea dispersa]QZY95844.1 hypothetical protein K7X52_05205 [Pantoea dispersa]